MRRFPSRGAACCARACSGFTLVELLVASVLLATALTAAAAAFSAATGAQAAALRQTTTARLAEAKLAEIKAQGAPSGGAEGTFAELEQDQTFTGTDLGDYSYRWEVTGGADFQSANQMAGYNPAPLLARAQVWVWYRDNERNGCTLICYLPSTSAAP